MLKKITLWTLYLAFVGMLILGAINRTTAILGDDHGWNANTTKLDLAGHEDDDHEAHGSPEHEWITLTGTVSS